MGCGYLEDSEKEPGRRFREEIRKKLDLNVRAWQECEY